MMLPAGLPHADSGAGICNLFMNVTYTYAGLCPMQPPVTFSRDEAAHPVFLIIFVLAGSCLVGGVCQGAGFLMWEVERDGGESPKAGVRLSPPWPPGIHISLCSDKLYSLRFAHSIRSPPLKGEREVCYPCSRVTLARLPDACTERKGLTAVGDRSLVFVVFAYALVACNWVFFVFFFGRRTEMRSTCVFLHLCDRSVTEAVCGCWNNWDHINM